MKRFWKPAHTSYEDAYNEARLEDAERELAILKQRADKAMYTLESRRSRNHWREAIESLFQGAV